MLKIYIKYTSRQPTEKNGAIRDVSAISNQIPIAHRLSAIMHADKIFVLERGHIIASGKHEELLIEKGLVLCDVEGANR